MTIKPMYIDAAEVYDLGKLTRTQHITGCEREGNIYVFYSKSSDTKPGFVLEERVGFYPDGTRLPLIEDGFAPRKFNLHPALDRVEYVPVVKRTRADGSYRRVMVQPPGMTKGNYKDVKYDISKWDKKILELMHELPEHVKQVLRAF